MIDFYYWTTPNGHKVTLFLEEAGLEYTVRPINIGKGDQFDPDFLKIAPNNRIPAIVDHDPIGGGVSLAIFESGAILEYLADKTGLFLAKSGPKRYQALQWLYWQMGGFGPMLGQNHHFNLYADEKIPYAINRYVNESRRLYGVLNQQLAGKNFIIGDDYTIADMACYPWALYAERQDVDLNDYPHIQAWIKRIADRPATIAAYAIIPKYNPEQGKPMTDEAKKHLYGKK
ncbi:Disulfide-bond oxidoreductase YfcG [Oligella sp. MSHR50489EDL]|uniref:glutathione binding-like protein n=1 Tax=Oligella sp. MSHR50489EDL TaxID=3139409 RepID=UPI003D819BAB